HTCVMYHHLDATIRGHAFCSFSSAHASFHGSRRDWATSPIGPRGAETASKIGLPATVAVLFAWLPGRAARPFEATTTTGVVPIAEVSGVLGFRVAIWRKTMGPPPGSRSAARQLPIVLKMDCVMRVAKFKLVGVPFPPT